jgi:DNA-binding IclR family transcriptional regulator
VIQESKDLALDKSVSSASKILRLLELVATSGPVRLRDLETATDLPKPSLVRLIATLVDEGYVKRQKRGEYTAALKLWRLGCFAVQYDNVRENLLPLLRNLVDETGETAHYAVYERGRAVYVEKVDGSHPIRAYTQVGSSSPAYATATGKALLAWQPQDEIARVLADAERHTDITIVSLPDFMRVAESIRLTGYAVNRGEWRAGVWGAASPIFDHRGDVIAAIGVSGPENRISANVDHLGTSVIEAAGELSKMSGWYESTTNGTTRA